MIIKQLKASHFRSYELLDISISSGISLFYGENGAGKSTILEAIQQNLTGRSFRTLNTNEMIKKDSSQYKIKVLFNNNEFIQSEKLHNKHVKYINSNNKAQKIKDLLQEVLKVNGTFITLFHNESMSGYLRWNGWQKVYATMLKMIHKHAN